MMKTFKKLITCSVISGTILLSASVWSSVDRSSWIFRISYIVFLWCNVCGRETIGFNVYIVISLRISFVIPWLIRKKTVDSYSHSIVTLSFVFRISRFSVDGHFYSIPPVSVVFHASANAFQPLTSVSKMAP